MYQGILYLVCQPYLDETPGTSQLSQKKVVLVPPPTLLCVLPPEAEDNLHCPIPWPDGASSDIGAGVGAIGSLEMRCI